MTKREFTDQFKRLRAAGYRLVVPDGLTVTDVIDEWYATFGGCAAPELARAIDQVKRTKPDTFWPAPGELWSHILQDRKERRIRHEAHDPGDLDDDASDQRREFLAAFQAFRDRLLAKMTMPDAAPQVAPEYEDERQE